MIFTPTGTGRVVEVDALLDKAQGAKGVSILVGRKAHDDFLVAVCFPRTPATTVVVRYPNCKIEYGFGEPLKLSAYRHPLCGVVPVVVDESVPQDEFVLLCDTPKAAA
jgi:hypothetical protein